MRKETASPEIKFSIVKVVDNSNRHDNIYSEISDELIDFKNDNVQWTLEHSEWQLVTATLSETQQLQDQTDRDEDIKNMDESAKSQDFFDDNATIGRRYTITRIKSRNFLCWN